MGIAASNQSNRCWLIHLIRGWIILHPPVWWLTPMFDGQTVESFIFRGEPQNLMVEVCRSPTNQMFNRYPAVDNRMLGPFTWHMNETGGRGNSRCQEWIRMGSACIWQVFWSQPAQRTDLPWQYLFPRNSLFPLTQHWTSEVFLGLIRWAKTNQLHILVAGIICWSKRYQRILRHSFSIFFWTWEEMELIHICSGFLCAQVAHIGASPGWVCEVGCEVLRIYSRLYSRPSWAFVLDVETEWNA